jgi:hypothetical protein
VSKSEFEQAVEMKIRNKAFMKRIDKAIAFLDTSLESAERNQELQRRTEMFWALQIQFMELSDYGLCSVYVNIMNRINLNKIQSKNYKLALNKLGFTLFPDEKACLATSLAVHLSGVEEL